jgi:thioredoxin 1
MHLRCRLSTTAAAKYNVSAMPTFVFLKGGEVVDRLMGANPARLQELIDEHK